MVLAIGTVVDIRGPCTSATADAYYHLARASTCEIAMIEEPAFDLLNALVWISQPDHLDDFDSHELVPDGLVPGHRLCRPQDSLLCGNYPGDSC
jgi:hypothetical protein